MNAIKRSIVYAAIRLLRQREERYSIDHIHFLGMFC